MVLLCEGTKAREEGGVFMLGAVFLWGAADERNDLGRGPPDMIFGDKSDKQCV
jgi:hypothetical protein